MLHRSNATLLDPLGGYRVVGGSSGLAKTGFGCDGKCAVVMDGVLVEGFASGRGSVSGMTPRDVADYNAQRVGVRIRVKGCAGLIGNATLWEIDQRNTVRVQRDIYAYMLKQIKNRSRVQ